MGVIECRHCGAVVNEDAAGCPACGADPRTGYIDPVREAALLPGASKTPKHPFSGIVGMAFTCLGATWWSFAIVSGINLSLGWIMHSVVPSTAPWTWVVAGPGMRVHLSLVIVLTGIVVRAWVGATIVALTVTYVRTGERPTFRGLGAGFPFLLWFSIGEGLMWLATEPLSWVFGGGLVPILVALALLFFVFYQQLIVDRGADIVKALGESARLVKGRYGTVLAYCFLGGLCFIGMSLMGTVLGAAIGHYRIGAELSQLVTRPFLLIFVTLMFFMANDERGLVELRFGKMKRAAPAGPAPPADGGTEVAEL